MLKINNNKYIKPENIQTVEIIADGNITVIGLIGLAIRITEKDFNTIDEYKIWQKELINII